MQNVNSQRVPVRDDHIFDMMKIVSVTSFVLLHLKSKHQQLTWNVKSFWCPTSFFSPFVCQFFLLLPLSVLPCFMHSLNRSVEWIHSNCIATNKNQPCDWTFRFHVKSESILYFHPMVYEANFHGFTVYASPFAECAFQICCDYFLRKISWPFRWKK